MRLPKAPRAFVTGGASGLGRALALAVAGRGGRVLVGDVHEARAAETVDLCRARGGDAHAIRCDVTRPEDLALACDEMERRFGGTDLLANNAGVAVAGRVGDVPLADWRWITDVNQWGVVHGCHAFVPRMRERRSGFILNVASCAGLACMPEMAPYNVTKAAVIALSETLAAELRPHGIAVTALCPTFFKTNLLESLRAPDGRGRRLAEKMFERARITSDEVAEAGIAALEAGRGIEIPQVDGKLVWGLKRFFPRLYAWQVGWGYGRVAR